MAKKILVIDDEGDICRILEFHLAKKGFEVIIAEDGEAGLKKAREHKPDAVILDLMLPKLSGEQVCRQIRGDARLSEIPVIMLTAKASEVDRVIGRVIGANYYLTKPFDIEDVLEKIRILIKQ